MPYCLQGKVSKGSLVQLRKELTLNVYTKDDKCILQTASWFVKKVAILNLYNISYKKSVYTKMQIYSALIIILKSYAFPGQLLCVYVNRIL